MAQVKPGETLLILADTWTDMEIAEACLIAGINAEANAQLLVMPRMSRTDMREFDPSIIDGSITPGGLISVPIICHVETGGRRHPSLG